MGLKVFSTTPPLLIFFSLVLTNAAPLPGFTCATVETGATVYVPLFVNQGDKIKIDTRTGEYLSRA